MAGEHFKLLLNYSKIKIASRNIIEKKIHVHYKITSALLLVQL